MDSKKIIIIAAICLAVYIGGVLLTYGGLTGRDRLANTTRDVFRGGKLRRKKGYKKSKH